MANPNNQEPLSMEDRVCKLEAQLSPLLVQLEVGRSDRSAPLVSAEESGYLVGGSEAVKIAAGDSELLMTNQEVEVCKGVDPCLVDNGMIKEEIAVKVIDKNEKLLAPVNRVGRDYKNDRDNEDGFNNSVEQMEKSVVVEGELMKNSHTPKMPYELMVKQAKLIAMIESPSLGLGALNPIGDNGEFKGMNMMVIFYPGGIKPEFSLNAQTNSSVQCVFDYGVLNTSACRSVRKLVGKTPNDYVNPDEFFSLEAVVREGVLVGNESDIVLLNVTLLSIALKTRSGSNVDGAGINTDFAILVRIVLTTMRLRLRVEVELVVFYANLRMQGFSGFPFDPGGIKPEFSLSARNNSTEQCVFEYGFLESRWLKPEGYLLIANEGLLIFRLLLDQFMDTLVEILLVAVVKLLMMGWYNKEEGKIPKNEVCCITVGGSAMRMVGYALQERKIPDPKDDKRGVLMVDKRLKVFQDQLIDGDEAVQMELKFTPQYGRIHRAQTEMGLTSSPRVCDPFGSVDETSQEEFEASYQPKTELLKAFAILAAAITGALIFVSIFKALTDLPPYIGMLLCRGGLWILTDDIRYGESERQHWKEPQALSRISIQRVLNTTELDAYCGNPRMQGRNEFPFDPGGILWSTLQLRVCKLIHAFKISQRVLEKMRNKSMSDSLVPVYAYKSEQDTLNHLLRASIYHDESYFDPMAVACWTWKFHKWEDLALDDVQPENKSVLLSSMCCLCLNSIKETGDYN
nr:sodium/proton antiporter 2-like [Ipomoea batatas]